MNTDKILALATYVRHRDGDALASPVHRAYMKEMSEWLGALVIEIQKEHLEYLHDTWHPDDKPLPEEITDPIFIEYWNYRNEREELKDLWAIEESNYWAKGEQQ